MLDRNPSHPVVSANISLGARPALAPQVRRQLNWLAVIDKLSFLVALSQISCPMPSHQLTHKMYPYHAPLHTCGARVGLAGSAGRDPYDKEKIKMMKEQGGSHVSYQTSCLIIECKMRMGQWYCSNRLGIINAVMLKNHEQLYFCDH